MVRDGGELVVDGKQAHLSQDHHTHGQKHTVPDGSEGHAFPPLLYKRWTDTSGVKVQQSYVVDSDGWDHAELVEVCRLVLRVVRAGVAKYETDLPVADGEWPVEVAAAAEVLRGVAGRTGRVEKGGYAQTGLVRADAAAGGNEETWAAFVTFAPWAYDAGVWGEVGELVSLSDEGRSIAVRLDGDQVEAVGRVIGAARLVPEKEWRAVWKQRRRERRSSGGDG
ncbi:hypothetical protein GCM10009554_28750 [Kribbella koreensis]|uniref:Uncharacterized protein n=1 Tax=Kribbella koreensis TaxID=57909 RepID=A0ABN1Q8N1_9ACTN